MKTLLALSAAVLLAANPWTSALAANAPFAGGRWIDLTHDFSTNSIYWPTASGFTLEVEAHGHTANGYFYAANRYKASEHGGTHIDAPIHFAEGKRTLDQIPVEQLIGPALVVDVSERSLKNPDYLVSVEDFTAWEKKHGEIPPQSIVLLRTGYEDFWPNAKQYLGTEEKGPQAVAKLHFPGLHPEAAKWLVSQRSIKAVGLDTASIDYGQSKLFEAHQILNKENVPAFENVKGLKELPPKGAYVIALPMKIKDGSGGPLRIVAWVPEK